MPGGAALYRCRLERKTTTDMSPEAIHAPGLSEVARIQAGISRVPRSLLEVRPVPAFKEQTSAAGAYQNGTPDGSRPGVFYYNACDLPGRFT